MAEAGRRARTALISLLDRMPTYVRAIGGFETSWRRSFQGRSLPAANEPCIIARLRLLRFDATASLENHPPGETSAALPSAFRSFASVVSTASTRYLTGLAAA